MDPHLMVEDVVVQVGVLCETGGPDRGTLGDLKENRTFK